MVARVAQANLDPRFSGLRPEAQAALFSIEARDTDAESSKIDPCHDTHDLLLDGRPIVRLKSGMESLF
jgi:hypothetical protein